MKAAIKYFLKWLFICLCIGLLVGSASALFLKSLDFVTNVRENKSWIIFFLPIAGFFSAILYHFFGKEAEKGNNLLIQAARKPQDKKIPFIIAPLVYLGTLITHLFGGSAGREGTALQMAAGISYQLNRLFKLNEIEKQALIISSISAGFSSVFGLPFAGAIFGIEFCFNKKINLLSVFSSIFSSFFAHYIGSFWNASHAVYVIKNLPDINFTNIVYACIAGIFFGLIAFVFNKSKKLLVSNLKRLKIFPPFITLAGGIVLLILIKLVDSTKFIGLGIPTIQEAFIYQLPVYFFMVKLIFTLITISSGFKGGEATPLFFIGATSGSALSAIILLPFDFLAGLGFVAVFGSSYKVKISSFIMAIELFGFSLEICLFFLIAILLSYYTNFILHLRPVKQNIFNN